MLSDQESLLDALQRQRSRTRTTSESSIIGDMPNFADRKSDHRPELLGKRPRSRTLERDQVDPLTFAARRLYRALSTAPKPAPDELVRQMLEDVTRGEHLSPDEIYKRIGVVPSKEEEAGELLPEDNYPPTPRPEPAAAEAAIPRIEEPAPTEENFAEKSQIEIPAAEPEQKRPGAKRVTSKTIARIANVFVQEENKTWDEVVSVIDHYGIRNTVDSATQYLLTKFTDTAEEFLKMFFPYKEFSLYLLVCLIQIVSFQTLLNFVPVIVCYMAFIFMIYWTLMLFHHRRVLKQLELFRQLLKAFLPVRGDDSTGNLDDCCDPEYQQERNLDQLTGPTPTERHLWHSVESQFYFTTSLVIFVLFFSLCSTVLPNSFFLGAVSIFLCGLCLVVLGDLGNFYIITVLVLEFVSHAQKLWLHEWPLFSMMINETKVMHYGLLSFHFGVASFAWFLIPFVLAAYFASNYAKKRSLAQTLTSVTTHCVVLLWWQAAIMLLMNVDLQQFEPRSILLTFAVLSLFLFRTNVAIGLVGSLAFVEIRDKMNFFNVLKALFIIFVLFIPFFYRKLKTILEQRSQTRLDLGSQSKLILLVVFYVFLVTISVTFLYQGTFLADRKASNLTWTQFESNCGSLKEQSENRVVKRMACSRYKGLVVSWRGRVESIDLVKIDNRLENLIDFLPGKMSHWLRCFYGAPEKKPPPELVGISQACDISSYNVYYFEILVSGPGPAELRAANDSVTKTGTILLAASQKFLPLVQQLQKGDIVSFVASFDKYFLKYPQKLQLLSLACAKCEAQPETNVITSEVSYSGLWLISYQALQFLFNFIFSPFAMLEVHQTI